MMSENIGGTTGSIDPDMQLTLKLSQADMRDMCALLEDIADSLPHNLNPSDCAKAAESLQPLIKRIHAFEESEIFPRYAAMNPGASTEDMLDQLRDEHCVDECYAEELCDALLRVSSASNPISPDTLGYMLRGFFESMRRHQAFEKRQFLIRS